MSEGREFQCFKHWKRKSVGKMFLFQHGWGGGGGGGDIASPTWLQWTLIPVCMVHNAGSSSVPFL